ncbi:MAG: hypothetical protein IT378_24850 [Sandaracinaceae bacterium]|nr:hypothetical protein [Sandaracinaceae bacterium]
MLEVIAIDRDGPARCGEQEGRPVGGRMILRHRAEMLEVTGHLYQSLLDGVAECSGHVELALIYEAGGRTTRIAIAQDGTFAHIRPARRTESFAFASSPFWSRLRARAAGRCDLPESPRGRDRPGD